MTTYKPVHGGFIRQCIEYVDPAFGFAIGINFWFAVRALINVHFEMGTLTPPVGNDHPSRNNSSSVSPPILARDQRRPTRSVYHHLPRRHRTGQYLPCPGIRLHRILHVIHQMLGRGLDDLLHVHHDFRRNSSHEWPYRIPLLGESWRFQEWHQGYCEELCASSI